MSIAELFVLGGADGPDSVGLDAHDWEYVRPLVEDVDHRMEGGIVTTRRVTDDTGRTLDRDGEQVVTGTAVAAIGSTRRLASSQGKQ